MKRIISIVWLLLTLTAIHAENNPYRSDVMWVTVPNHADWTYTTGEEAIVEVQVYKYGIPRDGVVNYSIGGDLLDSDHQGIITLKEGRATINMGTSQEPGFRDLRLEIELDNQRYKHHVKVGFSPEKIQPWTQEPADFMSYWRKAMKETQQYPLKYTKEYVPEMSDGTTDCWLIHLELNKAGQSLYGYLLMPKDAEKGSCPVVLTPPGAGVKTIKEVTSRPYFQENGMIRFVTEIHGLDPRMPESYFEEMRRAFESKDHGYLRSGLNDPDRYYMRHVYLGLVRCIDLLCSLPEWDGRNVITLGGSQGGALALVAAALDHRVNLCVANHPALSDMGAGSAGLTSGYPHFRFEEYNTATLRTMSYYDVVNFARHIRCETYMTWGYNDNTCSPTTSYAVWNTLRCRKTSLITPINEHWTSDATNRAQMEWVKRRLADEDNPNDNN